MLGWVELDWVRLDWLSRREWDHLECGPISSVASRYNSTTDLANPRCLSSRNLFSCTMEETERPRLHPTSRTASWVLYKMSPCLVVEVRGHEMNG